MGQRMTRCEKTLLRELVEIEENGTILINPTKSYTAAVLGVEDCFPGDLKIMEDGFCVGVIRKERSKPKRNKRWVSRK